MEQENQISCYILAGGKSSRMGEDKGLLMLHGKAIIEYLIDEIIKITTNILIITSNKAYAQFGFPLINDQIKEVGPAGGIDAMLQQTSSKKNIILSCDMPFIDAHSIQYLIAQSNSFEITCAYHNGYPEMMMSIIDMDCKQKWRTLLVQKMYKLSNIIEHFSVHQIQSQKLLSSNPNLFTNINCREDFAKACWHFQINNEINANMFQDLIHDPNTQIIDVRNLNELPRIESFPTLQIPVKELPESIDLLNRNQKLIFICHAGIRSRLAIDYLIDRHHFTNVYHLKGGIMKLGEV